MNSGLILFRSSKMSLLLHITLFGLNMFIPWHVYFQFVFYVQYLHTLLPFSVWEGFFMNCHILRKSIKRVHVYLNDYLLCNNIPDIPVAKNVWLRRVSTNQSMQRIPVLHWSKTSWSSKNIEQFHIWQRIKYFSA